MPEATYKDYITAIDIQRNVASFQYEEFIGLDDPILLEFLDDIEQHNDAIELHLLRTKSYKEILILPMNSTENVQLRKKYLQDEQKTFSGSKIFYVSKDGTKLLVCSVKDEMMNKLNMVVTRINKVNQRITQFNQTVRKDNLELYQQKNSKKDDVIHFLNQHLKS